MKACCGQPWSTRASVPAPGDVQQAVPEALRLAGGERRAGEQQPPRPEEQVDTVKTHMSHLYTKLEVTTRTAAVERARELGLLRPPEQI